MHEKNPKQLVEGRRKDKEERIMEIDKQIIEETSKKRMREEEKKENETVSAKRGCVGSVSRGRFGELWWFFLE